MDKFEYIINGCINNDKRYQKLLYDKFSSRLYAICIRYLNDDFFSNDILQDSFIKIFKNIKNIKNNKDEKSVFCWMKTIVINTALSHLSSNKIKCDDINQYKFESNMHINNSYDLDFLFKTLNSLSNGYRTVFNLYAIDGYSHKEISEILGISVSCSKSQYSRAKVILREKLNNKI